METIHIETPKTARVYRLGDPDASEIWVVLHGYGMSAETFIQSFNPILKPGVLVIAPEGLSRFYRKGFSGEVVASWMTREDRLLEIKDYFNYLDRVFRELIVSRGLEIKKVVLFGYSQGSATATRWIMKTTHKIHDLVVWCGDFVVDEPEWKPGDTFIWNVYATKDEFIPTERSEEQVKMLKEKGFQSKTISFDGGHTIPEAVLLNLYQMVHEKR